MDDQSAISRMKQGELDGLEALVNRYQAQAVHAAYMILYDRSKAEDIVQMAFIKVAERIHQFDLERPFAPWFFRIVVNDALKLVQKQKRNISLERPMDEATSQLAKCLIDPNPSPEQLVMLNENRHIILRAIQLLPSEQRAAIVMRYFFDMSMKDMSAETGRPLSTIKWWLRDAKKRLRSLIKTPQGGLE